MQIEEAFECDLFVSYSSKDKESVLDIVQRLESVGVRCWLDESAIEVGGSVYGRVLEGIKKSRKMLLIYSPDFFDSVWGKREYQSVLTTDPVNGSSKLLPIMLKKTDVNHELHGFKWLDATSPAELEKTMRKVIEAVPKSAPDERAYISYAHDSPQHKVWVAALHRKLRRDGVAVRFDYDFMQPGRSFWRDIERYITDSTSAILIGTPDYRYKATHDVSGLFREYRLLIEKSKRDPNFRMIPVLRNGHLWAEVFPDEVHDNFGIDMRPEAAEDSYPLLLRTLLSPQASAEAIAKQDAGLGPE